MDNNSCAIIGVGRVGLPLALHILTKGFRVIGIDIDKNLIKKVNNKEMPFLEHGCQKLLNCYDFKIYENFSHISNKKYIIITVGTPLLMHIECDLSQIFLVLKVCHNSNHECVIEFKKSGIFIDTLICSIVL